MSNIQNWAVILSLLAIACSIFEMMIPSGKIGKTVYTAISLFTVFSVIFPIFNLFNDFKHNFKSFFSLPKIKQNSKLSEKVRSQTSNLISENIKALIKSKLREMGIDSKKIEIFMDINESSGILMIRCKIYIDKEFKDFSSKIADQISKSLNIKTEIIEV